MRSHGLLVVRSWLAWLHTCWPACYHLASSWALPFKHADLPRIVCATAMPTQPARPILAAWR